MKVSGRKAPGCSASQMSGNRALKNDHPAREVLVQWEHHKGRKLTDKFSAGAVLTPAQAGAHQALEFIQQVHKVLCLPADYQVIGNFVQ